ALLACTVRAEPRPTTVASRLSAPKGFQVSVFAQGLTAPRFMAWGPDGVLYVTGLRGSVYAIKDGKTSTFAQGLNTPHGIAAHDGYLYVGEQNRVVRFKLGASGDPEV